MRSPGTHVLLVLALVITSRFEPPAYARGLERDAFVAASSTVSTCAAKRIEAPAPDGRGHPQNTKLLGLPRGSFALAAPDRARVCERRSYLARDHVAAPRVQQGARAPPHG